MARSLLTSPIIITYPSSADGIVRVRLGDGHMAEEHRVVMAKALGRDLQRGEIVRHLNGDKSDNAPTNLMVDERGNTLGKRLVWLVCSKCQKPFQRPAKQVNLSLKRNQMRFYCSKVCVGKAFGRGLCSTLSN